MIKFIGVSPLEAFWVVDLVDSAKREVNVSNFDLVVVRGEGNLKRVLGDLWMPESSQFYAFHIVMDRPTIILRLDVSSKDLLESSIYHELVHAKLHGHRRFYEINIPNELLPLGDIAPSVFYLISVAVKDYEVSSFLSSAGLAKTQKPLLMNMLEPDNIPWNLLDMPALTLALASKLKPIMFSLPLIGPKALSNKMRDVPRRFLEWVIDRSSQLGEDTISNIRYMSKEFLNFLSFPR